MNWITSQWTSCIKSIFHTSVKIESVFLISEDATEQIKDGQRRRWTEKNDNSRSVSPNVGPSNFAPSPLYLFCPTLVVFLFWCSPSSSLLNPFPLCVCFVSQCSRTPPSPTVWMLPGSVQSSALQFWYTEHQAPDGCIKNAPLQWVEQARKSLGGFTILRVGLYHFCSS